MLLWNTVKLRYRNSVSRQFTITLPVCYTRKLSYS